jgi:hypothetical protein
MTRLGRFVLNNGNNALVRMIGKTALRLSYFSIMLGVRSEYAEYVGTPKISPPLRLLIRTVKTPVR